jgi:hypothetical protein
MLINGISFSAATWSASLMAGLAGFVFFVASRPPC